MRFKTGFVVGCAAGAWAATKISHAIRGEKSDDADSGVWPRAAAARAKAGSPEVAAERIRAIGDMARERVGGLIDGPAGEMARQRISEITEMVTTSIRQASGGHDN